MISLGIGAIIFAIWFVVLFIGKEIGLSMLLFIIPFSLFFVYLLRKSGNIKNDKMLLFLVPIYLLSSIYFGLNNEFFNTINLIVIPILFSIMYFGLTEDNFSINKQKIGEMIGSIFNPFNYIDKGLKSFKQGINENIEVNIKIENKGVIKKFFKALLITAPIVLVIIILLSTADEMFANIFTNFNNLFTKFMISINSATFTMKTFIAAILFIYFIGLFYFICQKREVVQGENNLLIRIKDNFTIKMILISLNVIYLVFCYIQIKSLFIQGRSFNYANFAKQGFYQLMVVSVINLVTIIIAKNSENKNEIKSNRFINCMTIIMIVFTFIIVISAGLRMHLYESAYGYTLLRLLVYCILFTEIVLFIPTILYILDKRINLLKSYFLIILTIYICMNFANFDNIIAKRNVDRYFETGKIDLDYLMDNTGTDSIYQITRILDNNNIPNKTEKEIEFVKNRTMSYLKTKYREINIVEMDYRNYNLSKINAKNAIIKKLIENIK